eukprot:scaffold24866_cov63-Phaeocystis_antarctica.AAC.1
MLTLRNVRVVCYTVITSLSTVHESGGIARSKGIARLRVAILRLIEREASVVMWHNQRVINTPNHRYNCASDPRAIAVPLVTSASDGRYLPLWVMWTLSTVRATSLSKAESSCSSAASKLRPPPCAVTLRLFVGDLAHTQGSSPLERREDGWALGRAKALFRANLASAKWR